MALHVLALPQTVWFFLQHFFYSSEVRCSRVSDFGIEKIQQYIVMCCVAIFLIQLTLWTTIESTLHKHQYGRAQFAAIYLFNRSVDANNAWTYKMPNVAINWTESSLKSRPRVPALYFSNIYWLLCSAFTASIATPLRILLTYITTHLDWRVY